MDKAIQQFNNFVTANFISPQKTSSVDLDLVATEFKNEPLWLARLLVVQYVLPSNSRSDEDTRTSIKTQVLEIYDELCRLPNPSVLVLIEAARAAAVFEETDLLLSYIQKAEKVHNFSSNIAGVEVKYSSHQQTPFKRVSCLIDSEAKTSDAPTANSLENVEVHVDNDRYTKPKFVNSKEEHASTCLLDNIDYLLLLLHASYTVLYNPAATTTVVNEQALPYVRRITETAEFSKVNYLIAKRALYERSTLEIKDITELERGTVQLLKLSREMHTGEHTQDSLEFFHQVIPLGWRELDTMAARRVVAMSDFANAVPLYEYLEQPLDMAICLSAINKNDEALELLRSPALEDNPQALLLRGDICQDKEALNKAWDKFKLPQAKFRLAQASLADKDYTMSLSHIEDMLQVQSANHDALMIASANAMALKNWEKSILYLRRGLAIKDDDTRSWADLATAFLHTDQAPQAHYAIQQAIRVNQNSTPDLPTWTNYVALSAQLNKWDDVIVGLGRISECGDNGGAQYIVRLSGLLPRLVEAYLSSEYTGTGTQSQLKALFASQLPRVIPQDDPMLCRLNAQIKLWSGEYQQGLKAYKDAVESMFSLGDFGETRSRVRLQLYVKEYTEALEKYGDKEGRIEGSKAFPGWAAEVQAVNKKAQSLLQ